MAAEIRREAYGEDFGQQGWRTLDEQQELIGLVNEPPHGRLVDVACGSGGTAIAIAAATGCWLTGVDIEEATIEQAKSLAAIGQLRIGPTFIVANCSQVLPFEDDDFDVISCIDAIIHLADLSSGVCRLVQIAQAWWSADLDGCVCVNWSCLEGGAGHQGVSGNVSYRAPRFQ